MKTITTFEPSSWVISHKEINSSWDYEREIQTHVHIERQKESSIKGSRSLYQFSRISLVTNYEKIAKMHSLPLMPID